MKRQSMIGLFQATPVTDSYIAFKEYLYVSCTNLMFDALAMDMYQSYSYDLTYKISEWANITNR